MIEQKGQEKDKLSRRDELARTAFDGCRLPLALLTPQGQIVAANPAFAKFVMGVSVEVEGLPVKSTRARHRVVDRRARYRAHTGWQSCAPDHRDRRHAITKFAGFCCGSMRYPMTTSCSACSRSSCELDRSMPFEIGCYAIRMALLRAERLPVIRSRITHTNSPPARRAVRDPYDVHIAADGTTAEDGVEVIACTPRQLAGHVDVSFGTRSMTSMAFGSSADNQRCVAAGNVVTATASGSSGASSAVMRSGSAAAVTPVLIEQPYSGTESAFDEDLCKAFGLQTQEILMPTVVGNDIGDPPTKGMDMHVRIWSDAPNDLSGVIFLVRQLMSTHAPGKPEKIER